MATPNTAAFQLEAKGDLVVQEAEMYTPGEGEILVKNEAFAIQPLDAKIRKFAYMPMPYPFILGNSIAGIISAVGPGVTSFRPGDRVVTDTPTYTAKQTRYGAWQKYVVSRAERTTLIPSDDTKLETAITIPFALATSVVAFTLFLGMPKASDRVDVKGKKVLIWGAGGSVGGLAVQYAKSVGFEVIATASPRSHSTLQRLGASAVLDYKSPSIVADLAALGPYAYSICTSGDMPGQQSVAAVIAAQGGGKFASTGPGEAEFPKGVERIYAPFQFALEKPENRGFVDWWYGEFLGKALVELEGLPVETFRGLGSVQDAAERVVAGVKTKQVILPQEG